jgi:ferritin-like metal-binding protein YciE
MFASKKIKIDKSLYDRLAAAAQRAGYASTEELITHVLEREAASDGDDDLDQQRAEEQLRGLGYIE